MIGKFFGKSLPGATPLLMVYSDFLGTMLIAFSTGHTEWQIAHPVQSASIISGNELKSSNLMA